MPPTKPETGIEPYAYNEETHNRCKSIKEDLKLFHGLSEEEDVVEVLGAYREHSN